MAENNSLEDNLDMATYIMLHRIYDILTVIGKKINSEDTQAIINYHEQGYLLGPLPSYLADDNEKEMESNDE